MKKIFIIGFLYFFISCPPGADESDGPFPLTKERVRQILQKKPDPEGQQLTVASFKGCVNIPAKGFFQNFFVGIQFTRETCSVTVKPNNTIAVSFLENIDIPLVDTATEQYSTDIFLNEIGDNELVIVQHVEGQIVAVTHTVYDKKGYAVYGGYGEGDFIKSCVIGREPKETVIC